jgi:pimeloyl-ACP methyl ester carboxylesterase
VAAGYRVIRFDNRDAGLSTYMNHLKPENMFRRRIRGIVNATATVRARASLLILSALPLAM